MNPRSPHLTGAPPRSATPHSIAPSRRAGASPDRDEALNETARIIGAPAFFGPPVSFLLGPWLLLVLLLVPPAALLITLVLAAVVVAGLLAALVALVASPYLLVRHLRARHTTRRRWFAFVHRRAAPSVGHVPSTGSA